MKKLIGGRLGLAAAIAGLVLASCSDGGFQFGEGQQFDISQPKPIIISFAADPAEVEAGGSTTILWEVASADSVEITAVSAGDPIDFHVESSDLSGKATAANLSDTTDFIITATKQMELPEESEGEGEGGEEKAASKIKGDNPLEGEGSGVPDVGATSTSMTITVTVIKPSEFKATITADETVLAAGASTVIRWEVTPAADGTVVIVSADTGEPIEATDKCKGKTIENILGYISQNGAMDPIPVSGCAVVTPAATTNYTVQATSPDDKEATASVKVEVEAAEGVQAEILVNGEQEYQAPRFPADVTVSWRVAPATVEIAFEISSAAGEVSCEPALDGSQAEGSAQCTVPGETEFTIMATQGERTATETATVRLAGGGAGVAAGLVIAESWAFEGESIPISMGLTEPTKANPAVIEDVRINGQSISPELISRLKTEYSAVVPNVQVGESGATVTLVYGGGNEINYQPVKVLDLSQKALDQGVAEVTTVAYDAGLKHRYAGVLMDGPVDGAGNLRPGRIYKDGGAKEFDFISAIMGSADEGIFTKNFFKEDIKTFPVGAIAVRSGDPDEIYVGITGAVMKSKDSCGSFENIMVTRRRATKEYSGNPDHATCGYQQTQTGRKAQFHGDFISLNRICDIIAMEDGRVVVATDFGVQVDENIDDGHIIWIGTPRVGKTGPEVGALTFGHVTHDLEQVDSRIYAAADHGVFMSVDGAIHWQKFGDITGPVYAIAYSAKENKFYAGTGSGLFVLTDGSGAWTQTGLSEPVTTIAVDPIGGVIVAGTAGEDGNGSIQVSRDSGESFAKIESEKLAGAGKVSKVVLNATPIATADGRGAVQYGIAIATSAGGEFYSKKTVAGDTQPPAAPPVPNE